MDLEDLKPGMILKGTVRNIVDFGAFVDIGVHQDGLVHISQMTDRFIRHPLEAVSVGDIVDVQVLSVDAAKKRIALTMKISGNNVQAGGSCYEKGDQDDYSGIASGRIFVFRRQASSLLSGIPEGRCTV